MVVKVSAIIETVLPRGDHNGRVRSVVGDHHRVPADLLTSGRESVRRRAHLCDLEPTVAVRTRVSSRGQ